MKENIIYMISNAFRIYIYWKLMNTLFNNPKYKNIWVFIGFFLYYLINSTVSLIFVNFTLNVITNIVPLIILTFLYESKLSSKIVVSLAFYAVNMMADGMMYAITLVTGINSVIVSSGIATVLFTFLLELLFEYVLRKRAHHELGIMYFITILVVPLGSILIGIMTMSEYDVKVIAVSVILILFNIMVFYLYDRLQKSYEAIYEKRILEQAILAKNTELEIMKESQEKISIIRHDLKIILLVLKNMLKTMTAKVLQNIYKVHLIF